MRIVAERQDIAVGRDQFDNRVQRRAGAVDIQPDLRAGSAASALCIVPALSGGLNGLMATHPPLQQRLEQLARIQAELSRPTG